MLKSSFSQFDFVFDCTGWIYLLSVSCLVVDMHQVCVGRSAAEVLTMCVFYGNLCQACVYFTVICARHVDRDITKTKVTSVCSYLVFFLEVFCFFNNAPMVLR